MPNAPYIEGLSVGRSDLSRATTTAPILLSATSQISYLYLPVYSGWSWKQRDYCIRWVSCSWVSCKCYPCKGREITLTMELLNLTTKPSIHLEVEAIQIDICQKRLSRRVIHCFYLRGCLHFRIQMKIWVSSSVKQCLALIKAFLCKMVCVQRLCITTCKIQAAWTDRLQQTFLLCLRSACP